VNSAELKQRTKVFAHRCVKLASALPRSELGRIVSGQLMRSATSVASNYRAACFAQSKSAFVAKISIVLEEADESAFWMEFIIEEKLLSAQRVAPLYDEAQELTRIFAASRKTSKGTGNREVKR
jgi:four helix bundle protein